MLGSLKILKDGNIGFLVIGFFCIFSVAGCGTYKAYEGSKKPLDQVAIIAPTADKKEGSYLAIRYIGSKSMWIRSEGLADYHDVAVEPGEHIIKLCYSDDEVDKLTELGASSNRVNG